jgi:hypothetical protein
MNGYSVKTLQLVHQQIRDPDLTLAILSRIQLVAGHYQTSQHLTSQV